ncbi:Putative peptidyl-prolyl cis-trans isomerase Cbf2 [bacterium HR33]|nr:Putative peptidyl-prolyl cis-trans isomerase Cbf2 [bacterium HR33]
MRESRYRVSGMAMLRLAAIAVLLSPASALAQETQSSEFALVDRIVAIVGDVAIPFSRLEEEINLMRAQGMRVPADSVQLARFRRDLLDRLIDEELLVQQARRDTAIVVEDADVQRAVEEVMRRIRQQFRSQLEFERELRRSGFGTVEEYRRWVAERRRRELLQDALVRKLEQEGKLRAVQPTQAEMRAFYERVVEQQPPRPASLTFRQIVVQPQPDSSAVLRAFMLADSLARAIRGGADFAQVARRFSDDPATRERGGDLGWFRRGTMTPAFEDVAFRLRPGYVSSPVRTPFGFHIIQVQRAEPAEIQARHILIAPEITEENARRAKETADTLVALLRRGASFDSLARLHHDPTEESFVANVIRDSLPAGYREALAGAKEGDIVGPIVLERPGGDLRYAVVKVEQVRPEGPYTFEELRERIRAQLAREGALRRYLEDLRKRTYIEIRLP